jgi:hypothetical protein
MCDNCHSKKSTHYNIRFNHPRNKTHDSCYKHIYGPLFEGNAVLGPYKKSCYPEPYKYHNRCKPYRLCEGSKKITPRHHIINNCRNPCPLPNRPICYPPRCEPYYTESIYWY